MFKYKKIVAFFIIGVLLIGSGVIYTLSFSTETKVKVEKSQTAKSHIKKVQKNDMQTEELNEQIDELISGYLNAKLVDDISAMGTYVSDTKYIDENKLLVQNQYIESYNNIKCTIKKCSKKDTYRVYAYYDIKAFGVEQMLPSLSAYYVIKEKDGKYKIYFGKIDSNIQKQIEMIDKSSEITALKDSVQKRMAELISTDEEVRTLFDGLKNGE